MILTTAGIVLRTVKYGESSVIADIFTEEKGLHSFIGNSVRSARSRMPYNLFQPMTVVELVAYVKDKPDSLSRLKEMRAGVIFSQIPFDIRRGAITLFMAEICRKCLQEAEENRELYDFLRYNLQWLDATTAPLANIHLHFLIQLTAFLGFRPEAEELFADAWFDLKEGVYVDKQPGHSACLNPEEARQMTDFLFVDLTQCHEIALNRPERKQLLQKLLQFYQWHVPNFGTVNTPDIMEMVL